MNFVFLMDPLHTVIVEKDTTLALMVGAHNRGHKVYFMPNGGITRINSTTHFHVIELTPQLDPKDPFINQHSLDLFEEDVDAVFIRTDPPFDGQYLFNTWVLDLVAQHIPVINNPAGIRTTNEKVWATQFTDIVPPQIIGRNKKDLQHFLIKEKDVVAKPTDGFGGQSVFHVHQGDRNANVILETLTNNWKKDIIVQKFIPESKDGDKRILLLNGEPLGAVLRLHAEDDHRNNFFSGGSAQPAEIGDRDLKIIKILKPHLKRLGLYFVGIDVIGDYLTEVNVTSPTCLQEMNRLNNVNLEDQVIAFAEKLVEDSKSNATINS